MKQTHYTFVLRPLQRAMLIGVPLLAGAALGWFFPVLTGWLNGLPWFPFAGPVELLGRIQQSAGRWALVVLGLVAGVIIGALLIHHSPRVMISKHEIVVHEGPKRSRFARSQVAELEVAESRLILRDAADVELLRSDHSGHREQVVAAARELGWPVVNA